MTIKISIITVCLNSENTILKTLNSVINQKYPHIEHIIVDGGSTDKTIYFLKNYRFKKKKIFYMKNLSLYKSLNFGIKKASGEIITFLHSDDIFNSKNTIQKVIRKIEVSSKELFFGDVIYFREDFKKIFRHYTSKNFSKFSMRFGNMPPHTGSFYRKNIFKKFPAYKDFKIAADFEHLFRIIYKHNIEYENLNLITTRMRAGGLSGKSFSSYVTISRELVKSLELNGFYSNFFLIHFRIPYKIIQYIRLNKNLINKEFNFRESKFLKRFEPKNLNLITNIKKINFQKNFYLSALNLAFLGAYAKGIINYDKSMINWADGIFAKLLYNFKKTPGREIINNLRLPNSIKRIIVMGNLSEKSKDFLIQKFNKKIINIQLPYGDVNFIKKNFKIVIEKSDLIFLTLPTPKQEQIAKYLSLNNKFFKIICIGGSINIASNEEKPVPNYLKNYEFLWRLRYETRRRLARLFQTFFSVLVDRIFFHKIKNIKIKKI